MYHFWYFFVTITIIQVSTGQRKSSQKCVEYMRLRTNRPVEGLGSGRKQPKLEDFPHMAALGFVGRRYIRWYCSGTLISTQFILTVAHCTWHRDFGEVRLVRLGGTSTYSHSYNDVEHHRITEIVIHPKYKPPSYYNDIALLKLEGKIRFSGNIFPACLNNAFDVNKATNKLIGLGWTNLGDIGSRTIRLVKVDLRRTSQGQCNAEYKYVSSRKLPNGIKDEVQICASGADSEEESVCLGTSGGPLEYRNSVFHFIVGVTSFGRSCDEDGTSVVYTRVSTFVEWIESVVWP